MDASSSRCSPEKSFYHRLPVAGICRRPPRTLHHREVRRDRAIPLHPGLSTPGCSSKNDSGALLVKLANIDRSLGGERQNVKLRHHPLCSRRVGPSFVAKHKHSLLPLLEAHSASIRICIHRRETFSSQSTVVVNKVLSI